VIYGISIYVRILSIGCVGWWVKTVAGSYSKAIIHAQGQEIRLVHIDDIAL
jgi:hypothetical protein